MTSPSELTVLGIDPGLANTGWCVYDVAHGRVVDSGVIKTSTKTVQAGRLFDIYRELKWLLRDHKPFDVAMETLTMARGHGKLESSEALGVIRLTAWRDGFYVHDYSPSQVKKSITGDGRASKEMMALSLADLIEGSTHEVDALAVAITHAKSGKL